MMSIDNVFKKNELLKLSNRHKMYKVPRVHRYEKKYLRRLWDKMIILKNIRYKKKVICENNLIATEAIYHLNCYVNQTAITFIPEPTLKRMI